MKSIFFIIGTVFSMSAFANNYQYLIKINVERCDSTSQGSRRSILERSETVVRTTDLVKSPSDLFDFSELRKSLPGRNGAFDLYIVRMNGNDGEEVIRVDTNYETKGAKKSSAFLTVQTNLGSSALGVAGRCETAEDEGKLNLQVVMTSVQ